MTLERSKYERFIQVTRVVTAWCFVASGVGLVVCSNARIEGGAILFGTGMSISFAVVVMLVFEQLLAAWIRTNRGRVSLAAMLVITAVAAVFFAIMRSSIALAFWTLAFALVFLGAVLEGKRTTRSPREAEDDDDADKR